MAKSIYDMSDEEIANLSESQVAAMSADVDNYQEGDDTDAVDEDTESDSADAEEDAQEVETDAGTEAETNEEDAEEGGEDDSDGMSDEEFAAEMAKPAKKEAKVTEPATVAKTDTPAPTGTPAATAPLASTAPVMSGEEAQEAVSKILAPFKASGREIKVKSVDDALTLMKMGANYSDKMTALKPHLAMLKLLEKNNLLDANKINYLIDIHQQSPGAINKLIKDSGIDPMDIDAEKANEYAPTQRVVSDSEMQLDATLKELDSSEHYGKLLTVVGEKWDNPSKDFISKNPGVLHVLHEHIRDGYYDAISEGVANERMLGRLTGISDLEAYKQVGDKMYAEGKFNAKSGLASAPSKPDPVVEVLKPNLTKASPDAIAKKKKVSATRSNSGSSGKTLKNPFEMSDEEFAKLNEADYIKG